MKLFFRLFLILLALIIINTFFYSNLYAKDKSGLSVLGTYDTRLGDLWSISLFSESGNKANWFGGGYGGFFINGAAADAEKASEDAFNSRYSGRGSVDVDSDASSYNLFYAHFPDVNNTPWYIGLSYSVTSFESEITMTNYLDGESGKTRSEWSRIV